MPSTCVRSALILVGLVLLDQPHGSLGTACNELPADHRINQRRFHCCTDTDEELISCLLLCGPAGSKQIEFVCNLTSGEWNQAFDPYDFQCGELVVPEFPDGCPANLEELILASDKEDVSVIYPLPRAIGSSGGYVQVLGSPAPGSVFKLGTTNVTVTAIDRLSQLNQTCTFAIRVKRLTCDFHELNKAKPNYVKRDDVYQGTDYYKLTCPSGYDLYGGPFAICKLDIHTKTKSWMQPVPFCHNCLPPRKPKKGDVDCGRREDGGVECTLKCGATLIKPTAPTDATCLDGKWKPFGYLTGRDIEWDPFSFIPDCIARLRSSGLYIEVKIYNKVPVCNEEKMAEAQLKWSAMLPSINFTGACNNTPCVATFSSSKCLDGVNGVNIEYILDVMVKTIKHYNNDYAQIKSYYAISQYFCAYIRNHQATITLPVLSAEHTATFSIYCDVYTTCSIPGTNPVFNSDACVGCGQGYVQDIYRFGGCDKCPPNTYQGQEIGLACTPCPGATVTINRVGSSLSDCKDGCGLGMWLNVAQTLCLPCPKGTYQDQDAATSCKPCPPPATTLAEKAVALLDCVELCPPGQWSLDGAKPCKPCPVGTYQPEGGATQCVACPFGMSTLAPGQSSIDGCVCKCHILHEKFIYS
ncbi:sushi, von Willebrand factor type A, EGF and pentraxin domain-containing protein 1-like [Physella acuta]|uniref:sushi, von Willebrand factor type A, EGF and pentraxin domain-containing protein 1-like n=1 Tax=Physella acuta TaxID=109671 RepID=UPI0027DDAD60|nr:sushi, von Willebrand factor type A, EGF and pentraxin domain-containing protein 1-like [Physella acuta]